MRRARSIPISSMPDQEKAMNTLAKELGLSRSEAVHRAVRQSLKSIGIEPEQKEK